ncbi:MAG: RNA polymerase sigma factor FliA [Betaproteobacteria bacterium]|nr:RNA polymerase sigma factor FliA [Betaproteobacteria bacterium]
MYTAAGTLRKNDSVQEYAPLVKRIAHHLMAKLPASVQIEDIIQAGLIGLMDAVNRFEQEQGVQFETYASQRIRGAMLDELRRNDWLPRGVRRTQRKIETALHTLEQKLGRSPNEGEVATHIGVPLTEYQSMLQEARGCQLLYIEDFNDEDRDDGFLERNVAEADADPLRALQDDRFREALIGAIEKLPEREKMLMSMYYEQDLNFREIAAVMGVTESRVCQLHTQAVSRLRTRMKDW